MVTFIDKSSQYKYLHLTPKLEDAVLRPIDSYGLLETNAKKKKRKKGCMCVMHARVLYVCV